MTITPQDKARLLALLHDRKQVLLARHASIKNPAQKVLADIFRELDDDDKLACRLRHASLE
jgi:hypothetical protein